MLSVTSIFQSSLLNMTLVPDTILLIISNEVHRPKLFN